MENAKGLAVPGGPFEEHRNGEGAASYTNIPSAGDWSVNRWQPLSLSHTEQSRIAEELSWLPLQLCLTRSSQREVQE